MAGRRAGHHDGGHLGFLFQQLITDKVGCGDTQVFVGRQHLHAAGKALCRTGLLPLGLHFPFKAIGIHLQPMFAGYFGGKLRGKAVGVVEYKGFLPSYDSGPFLNN